MFGALGAPTPDAAVFPDRVAAPLSVGAHLGGGVDVRAGVNLETSTRRLRAFPPSSPRWDPELPFYDRTTAFRTRAATVSLGLTRPAGPLEVRGRVGAAYDVLDVSTTTRLPVEGVPVPVADLPTIVEAQTGTFVHTSASAAVAVPVRRGAGSISPGVGAAVGTSGRLRGSLGAPSSSAALFGHVPSTVRLRTFAVTLEATGGVQRTGDDWSPFLDGGVRLDF